MHIVWLLYNSIISPTEIVGFVSLKDKSEPKYFNIKNRDDTPFYHFPMLSKDELKTILNGNDELLIVDKKYLFKFQKGKKLYSKLIDVESLLWKNGVEFERVEHKDYKYIPLVYYFDKIKEFRNLLQTNRIDCSSLPEAYDIMLYATSVLETSFMTERKKYDTEYNFFTVSGRFHEVGGNAISMRKDERNSIRINGVKIDLDLDGAHLRILDMLSGSKALLPPNTKAVQHIIDTSSNEIDKKGIYTSLYSESFVNVDHPFFKRVAKKYKSFKSPLERNHNNFNYIIQEYEVLLMSYIIYYFSCPQIRFVLYLYDGLIIDVHLDYLKQFLDKAKSIAFFPFKLSIIDKHYFIHMSTENVKTWEQLKLKAKMAGKVRVVSSDLIKRHEKKEENINKTSDTENLTNQ